MSVSVSQQDSQANQSRLLRVAILGNPNTGKSTLFNAMTGLNVRTGNYPGVTVEKRIGRTKSAGNRIELIDLPGAYSLTPQAQDELIAVEVVLGMLPGEPPPDVLLCIASAENLERHLFVVSQALDLGLPIVLALNMWDAATSKQVEIDVAGLEKALGVPIVTTEAHRRKGIPQLLETLVGAASLTAPHSPRPLPELFYEKVNELQQALLADGIDLPQFFLERAVLDEGGPVEKEFMRRCQKQHADFLTDLRTELNSRDVPTRRIESRDRYGWIREHCLPFVKSPIERLQTWTDRLDRVLTHRIWGFLVFLAVMFVVYQAIFFWATPAMDALEGLQEWAAELVLSSMSPGPLRSMLIDSVIGGAGTVLIFIPQIALLFLFIAILEDCGYMPRVAFMMDRLMSSIGLNGKSFIPLMSSFACAIPGVMAARVIENPRDRLITILVAPLMSCSARLPVYVLLIGAFIPPTSFGGISVGGFTIANVTLQGLMLLLMSSLGAIIAVPIAWLFRKTLLQGDSTPFLLEMPEYKTPSVSVVLSRVLDRIRAFIVRAGTLILASSVLIWAAGYFPGDRSQLLEHQRELVEVTQSLEAINEGSELASAQMAADVRTLEVREDELQDLINAESARLLEVSFLGSIGHLIAPVVKPLGWDWRIGVSAVASFPAREVVISTMGTIYSLGSEVDEEDASLIDTMKSATWPNGEPIYNVPVALSIMVFFALCAQCVSTLLVIRRETNSWRWPIFCFVYMTLLAYLGALVTYQTGMLFTS